MRLVFRILVWALLGLCGLALGAALLAYYLAARSLPDYDGSYAIDGPEAAIQIVRDSHAIPHVFAESDRDAFFALGWAHAEDRLWQLELHRRTAQGRLAELFGPRALPVDRTMRALDLAGHARDAVSRQSEAALAALDAYAQGVNARIRVVNAEALGRGAPEFFIFGEGGLAPWTPADSLGILKLMALRMTTAARLEARRARLLAQVGPEMLADLDPDYPDRGLIALPSFSDLYDTITFPAERAAIDSPFSPLPEPGRGGASNAWAVDAGRAASDAPLLATDPHLWLSAPGVWYLARLSSPGHDVIGGTIPGIPAVLIGRNARFGWGLTTAQVDDQDLFIEQLHPDDPERYRTPDGWSRFDTRQETIRVAGGGNETLVLRRTRHGPVMPPGADLDFSSVTPEGHVVALAWTALTGDDSSLDAALGLMRAQTVEEGAEAVRAHVAPAQNVVMADEAGIGMVVAGAVPLRHPQSPSRGRLPALGWIAENDWQGMMAREALPRALRPLSGAVANANNRTTNAPFPEHLSFDWAEPYRIRRLAQRIGDREFHSRESFMEMQNDIVSEMARAVLPLVARDLWWGEAPSEEGPAARRRARALDLLAEWNGSMSEYDPEPLIFAAWMRALTRRIAADELGTLFPDVAGPRPLLVERVFHDVDGAGEWCDVVKTPEVEDCPTIARRALDDALTELAETHGGDMTAWRWGAAHRAVHLHTPLGFSRLLGTVFNISHETSGGDHTLNVGRTPGRGAEPYANVHAAGLRAVYDFADLDRSVVVTATGQSGHPLSRHFEDIGRLARQGDYLTMSLDPEDARAGSVGTTLLLPRAEGQR
jgi:penicillin amidase